MKPVETTKKIESDQLDRNCFAGFGTNGGTKVTPRHTKARIVNDKTHPGMFRVRWPDGKLSVAVNAATLLVGSVRASVDRAPQKVRYGQIVIRDGHSIGHDRRNVSLTRLRPYPRYRK